MFAFFCISKHALSTAASIGIRHAAVTCNDLAFPLTAPIITPDGQNASASPSVPILTPVIDAASLWQSFGDVIGHLSSADRHNLFACLHVLLASVGVAVRAIQIQTLHADDDVQQALEHMERCANLETLAVVSAVTTARDFLLLRLDAPTVAAALLSDVITELTPTWPGTPLPDEFRLHVGDLLSQTRSMRLLQGAIVLQTDGLSGLDDASALVVRSALLGAVEASGVAEERRGVDPRALLVLLGSALTQLRAASLRSAPEQRRLAIESIQLYAPLAHAVGFGRAFAELETLAYARLFPDSLRRLQRWYREIWPDGEALAHQLRAALEIHLLEAPSLTGLLQSVVISTRVKTVPSTFRKLLRAREGARSLETVHDIVGLRVVLTPKSNAAEYLTSVMHQPVGDAEAEALLCHGAYRQVLRLWTQVPGRFKDFVTVPKANGYQSIHANMALADGRVIEIQIRSLAMHQRATVGSASHEGYRANQLGGGLTSLSQGMVQRTSLALRAVQAADVGSPRLLPSVGAWATEPECIDTAVKDTVDGIGSGFAHGEAS